ncbi:hypothetical protein Golax_022727, partial [Gossypium laxum]|nr:hypothetical protein [Gossypium laxum]
MVFQANHARVQVFCVVSCLSYPIRKARELEAIENLDKAYHSNPEEVVRHYNDHFSRTMLEFYITKRVLANRKRVPVRLPTTLTVAGDVILIGKKTGRSSPTVPLDLLEVLPVERMVSFTWSMTIKLQQELIVTSDKTIDARGANVEICNGAGITIQFTKNVIIHGLQIHHIIPAKGGKIKDGEKHHGLRGASDGDGVSLFGATNVW